MQHNQDVVNDLVRRMRKIEGQARGIIKMLEEGRECEAVLIQLAAMKAGINKVGMKALGCQLGKVMAQEIIEGGDGSESIEQMMDVFLDFA
jgi:DNA-binding FrmR family transcriptional regulator